MNSSLILSTPPAMSSSTKSLREQDRDTYNPAILTYTRFAEMYATDFDIYLIHFFSVRKAIVEISVIGPHMPFMYSRRTRDLPTWIGLPSKFNDMGLLISITTSAVLVFTDESHLQLFRDVMCTRLPNGIRYCMFPTAINDKLSSVDDTVITMAKYYNVHGHLYDNMSL